MIKNPLGARFIRFYRRLIAGDQMYVPSGKHKILMGVQWAGFLRPIDAATEQWTCRNSSLP